MIHRRHIILFQYQISNLLILLFHVALTMSTSDRDVYNNEKIVNLQLQLNTFFNELNVIENENKGINLELKQYDEEVKQTGNFERVRLEWEALQWDKWNNDQLKIKKLEAAVAISAEIDELKLDSET